MQPVHEREELKRYYQDEKLASAYVDERFLTPRGAVIHRTQVDVINDLVAGLADPRALEIAPGPARVTREIRGLVGGVAADASPQMLAIAARAVDTKTWNLVEADAYELDLGQKFPLVYSFRFIRHLEQEPRRRIYDVVANHLEPGGWFVFDAPNEVVEAPIRKAKPEAFPVYDKLWKRDELIGELEGAGFEVVRLVGVMRWHGVQRVVSKAFEHTLRSVGTSLVGALEKVPGREPLEWTVVCRR